MRKKILLVSGGLLLLSGLTLTARIQHSVPQNRNATYRDQSGRISGTAVQHGNRTTYRDRSGKISGTAVKQGNTVTYRDRSGKIVQRRQ